MATYLDAAAGAPLHPVARAALLAALDDGWADPARLYRAGRLARQLLDAARESVAESLGARPDEVSFAANGTQALHAAVLGALAGNARAGRTLVHSSVEHSAVLHAAEAHVAAGGTAVPVGVDALGRVDAAEFTDATRAPGVVAAALQAANHEVGTTQPVSEVAGLVPDVALVVDATQTMGHAPVPDGWSVLAGDARTWGGPSVGVLAVRTGVRWRSVAPADEREAGRVPGVPNLPAIVAAAASLRAVCAAQPAEAARQSALVER
ncbi:MAG: cysteine desulfurase, partial [Pseudonocardiales bacterium]|nr:cysteine desulfurase [Pseudonocardiales bacterium]